MELDQEVKLPKYGDFVIDLEETPPEYIWNSVFTKRGNQRNEIRKLEKEGVVFSFMWNNLGDELAAFVELYRRTVERAGGTPRPFDFFSRRYRSGEFVIFLAKREEKLIGGIGLSVCEKRHTMEILAAPYDQADKDHNEINLFDYWKAFQWAAQNGIRWVNLGTTLADPADGIHRFKKQFRGRFRRKSFASVWIRAMSK